MNKDALEDQIADAERAQADAIANKNQLMAMYWRGQAEAYRYVLAEVSHAERG